MKYAWGTIKYRKPDGSEVDPQIVGEHIESLVEHFEEHLTPDEILADARKRTSPLNSMFEWNENDAAEKWRRRQAKNMMNNLVVKTTKKDKTRAFVFVHNSKHGRRVYINLRSAMARTELREQVIDQALKGLNRWIGRYGGQRELRFVASRVEGLRRRMEAQYMSMI